jgi:hypothetical protein
MKSNRLAKINSPYAPPLPGTAILMYEGVASGIGKPKMASEAPGLANGG